MVNNNGLLVLLLLLALPIAELVIGTKYSPRGKSSDCSNDLVILPATWLIVSGAMSIVFIGLFYLSISIDNLFISPRKGGSIALQALFSLFFLAWSIVGCVMLWRDNLYCKPAELHDMLYASVIIHLVSVALPLINRLT
jgi:hypothetical protein